jgi:hypothetical protein
MENKKYVKIKSVGNYLQCGFCGKMFGNGISIVYEDIVRNCSCEGMQNAKKLEEMEKEIAELRKVPNGKK